MKLTVYILSGIAFLLGMILPLPAQSGGDYELSWYSVDGGGGVSTTLSEQYTIIGTIGQHDAHPGISGGDYVLGSGFFGRGSACYVDLYALSIFASEWLTLEFGFGHTFDLDNNSKVNLLDFNYISEFWLLYCPEDWGI